MRRLMRESGLSAATRVGRARGPRAQDGTIIPDRIDAMWDEPSSAIGPRTMANDMTAAFTAEHGQLAVFVAVDHRSAECAGVHAALRATRHEALEPIRQGVLERFGAVAESAAQGPSIRHGHGGQSMSHDFQRVPARGRPGIGATSSPALARAPEGDGCAERFIRTLEKNLLWVRTFAHTFGHRRGAPPGPVGVPRALQRALADRAPRTPLARPVPTRPDGPPPAGRINTIRGPRN